MAAEPHDHREHGSGQRVHDDHRTGGVHTGHKRQSGQLPVRSRSSSDDHPQNAQGGKYAGHDVEQFRRRFWWSLLLTVPVVATSDMIMDWFGHELDFPAWSGSVQCWDR